MFSKTLHQYVLLIGTILLVIGLPLSPFLLSISQLIIALNWVLELNFRQKFLLLKNRKSILFFISLYLIHLFWLINSKDFNYALHDLQIKLPLLALPIIYGTSNPFSQKDLKTILQFFVIAVIINSLISTYIIFGLSKIELTDSRYASLFISHIRFSLFVVFTIYILVYFTFFSTIPAGRIEKGFYIASIFWLACFLLLLNSFTGIIIFILLIPIVSFLYAYYTSSVLLKRILVSLNILMILSVILFVLYSYNRYNKKNILTTKQLELRTLNGNSYSHYPERNYYENGHKVWIYVCEKELKKEWNKRSKLSYDSCDLKGQALRTTLIRYLTSVGNRKDSMGVNSLSDDDIKMIEKGYANYLHKNKMALYPKFYEIYWQLDNYKKSGDPGGQSLTQRMEYLKTSVHMMQRFFWFGTGTGDINVAFLDQYKLDNSPLNIKWRHRAHNQFVTFFLSFGIFGFLWIIFVLFLSPFLERKNIGFLFVIFFSIGLLSMLNEDTLETQAGVSFFAFFYTILLYSAAPFEKKNNDPS